MKRCNSLGWLLALGALMWGCGSDPVPEPETPVGAGSNATGGGDGDKDGKSDSGPAVVDPRIVELCNLPEPRFEFDSQSLSGQATGVLDLLAECFINGKGKGKGIKLVGHADPRGETEYNFGLGQRRAGTVEQYLEKKGLEDERVGSSSRGELDASGEDDPGWARDRRVDILLAD